MQYSTKFRQNSTKAANLVSWLQNCSEKNKPELAELLYLVDFFQIFTLSVFFIEKKKIKNEKQLLPSVSDRTLLGIGVVQSV